MYWLLKQRFSHCGPWTSSIIAIWELVTNLDLLHQKFWELTPLRVCLFINPIGDSDACQNFRTTTVKQGFLTLALLIVCAGFFFVGGPERVVSGECMVFSSIPGLHPLNVSPNLPHQPTAVVSTKNGSRYCHMSLEGVPTKEKKTSICQWLLLLFSEYSLFSTCGPGEENDSALQLYWGLNCNLFWPVQC